METREPKERPVIFSGLMVEAILEGRKTQTRRVVKPQPVMHDFGEGVGMHPAFVKPQTHFEAVGVETMLKDNFAYWRGSLPYGRAGDRLWVRETWYDNLIGRGPDEHMTTDAQGNIYVVYRADGEFDDQFEMVEGDPKWRPSIFMPRWASRILLEVVSVRVEMLHEISEVDAVAEGCKSGDWITVPLPSELYNGEVSRHAKTSVESYEWVWRHINNRHGGTFWEHNPFVWVVEFKRIEVAK